MTTIIINERTKLGKLILGMVIETKCGEIVNTDGKIPNKETMQAINEARKGRTKKYSDPDSLLKNLAFSFSVTRKSYN